MGELPEPLDLSRFDARERGDLGHVEKSVGQRLYDQVLGLLAESFAGLDERERQQLAYLLGKIAKD